MGQCRTSALGKLGVVLLLLLGTFAISVRPLVQPHGRLDKAFGFRRLPLVSEAAPDHDMPVAEPLETVDREMPLLFSLPFLVLKLHRVAYDSVPVRRLKLPPRHSTSSILSD